MHRAEPHEIVTIGHRLPVLRDMSCYSPVLFQPTVRYIKMRPPSLPPQLPLGFFDDPSLDPVSPEDRLADKDPAAPGVSAYSRFYDNHGSFAWADCYVMEYDR